MSPTAKRALFQSPVRRSKRAKTSTTMKTAMRVPKSMQPEMKHFLTNALQVGVGDVAQASIPLQMSQGDDSTQFDGSKFRIARIRVNYDWSDLTLTEGVRLSVVIPKNVASGPGPLTAAKNQWDTSEYTILYDMLLPPDLATSAGTFDVTGPINVQMTADGTSVIRNNVYIYAHSAANGANLFPRISYSCWFTG